MNKLIMWYENLGIFHNNKQKNSLNKQSFKYFQFIVVKNITANLSGSYFSGSFQ